MFSQKGLGSNEMQLYCRSVFEGNHFLQNSWDAFSRNVGAYIKQWPLRMHCFGNETFFDQNFALWCKTHCCWQSYPSGQIFGRNFCVLVSGKIHIIFFCHSLNGSSHATTMLAMQRQQYLSWRSLASFSFAQHFASPSCLSNREACIITKCYHQINQTHLCRYADHLKLKFFSWVFII
jgi:hypothetical protein